MKKLLFKILHQTSTNRLLRLPFQNATCILTYHGFTDKETHEGIENHQGKHVFIKKFEEQICYLKKNYSLISLNEWLQNLPGGVPKRSSAIITMDDGYRSNFTLAFPILKKYNAPATIFLATSFVENYRPLWPDRLEYIFKRAESQNRDWFFNEDSLSMRLDFETISARRNSETVFRQYLKRIPQASREEAVAKLEKAMGLRLNLKEDVADIYRPLLWSDIQEMQKSGLVSIGSHTHNHAILTGCTDQTLENELSISKEIIEKNTGEPCALFCYPNGGPEDFDSRTKKALQKAGYSCGLTTVEGFNKDDCSDVFELKRLGVRNQVDLAEFAMTLCGFKKALSDGKKFATRFFSKDSDRSFSSYEL